MTPATKPDFLSADPTLLPEPHRPGTANGASAGSVRGRIDGTAGSYPHHELVRCVGDVDAFVDHHWDRAPLLRRAAGPFDDLLSLDAVETMLDSSLRRPTVRVVRSGEPVSPDAYTSAVRMGGADVPEVVRAADVMGLFATGATIVLQGLQRTWPPLVQFCRGLERSISHPVQANAYLSPPGAAGLRRHADRHDVVVLAVSGTKHWDVESLGGVELNAGDALYVPAGSEHEARTATTHSLHITIGVLRVTYRDVLRRTLAELAAEPSLDDPLPIGYGREDAVLADELGARFGATARALDDVDAQAAARREVGRTMRRRAPLSAGRLGDLARVESIEGSTRLRLRDIDVQRAPTFDPDGRIVLHLPDSTLRFPTVAGAALDVVLAGQPFVADDLCGLDAASRLVMARRLIREGVVGIIGASPDHRPASWA